MNFDAFKETLTSFARTAERLRAFVNPALKEHSTPPRLVYPDGVGGRYEVPRIDAFAAIHSLCIQSRRISCNQRAWNQQLSVFCHEIGETLPVLWDTLRVEDGPVKKAKSHLEKMRTKFKEAQRRSGCPQRKINSLLLKAVQHLVRAHNGLGKRRLKTLGISADELRKKTHKNLRGAERSNSKAGRGLRRLLGRFALDQRSINDGCFRALEKLLQIHRRFLRLQKRRQQKMFQESALALQQWLSAHPEALSVTGRETNNRPPHHA
jgi:hypothetical protein